jgi:magnesium and cobalt transporter
MSTKAIAPQPGPETGKSKSSPSWIQRMAANLGFSSAPSLRETLETAIREPDEGDGEGTLSAEERDMLLNVLEFGETKVSEVMLPRADIVAIEESRTVGELLNLFARAGHSRVPVFRESLDNPVGMVHIKDAIAWMTPGASPDGAGKAAQNFDLSLASLEATIAEAELVREALFVPSSMPALALLARMKAKKIHLALVVDEHGGTDGLVTFQDVVEEIMGDIADEHDVGDTLPIASENEAFIASAKTPIESVEQAIKVNLTNGGAPDDIGTLGGLIMATVGRVPKRGQIIPHPSGVIFEIVDAGPRRVHTVRIHKQRSLEAPEQPLLLPAPDGAARADDALGDARAA